MSAPNKLLYSVVSRGTVVLAEHRRVSYTQDMHMFHVLINDGITFLCMAEETLGRRIPFAFLEDIKAKFFSSYAHICKEAVAYEYNTDFSKVLSQRMDYFSNDPQADTLNRVRGEIAEVKNIMIENIEKVLDRGEKLDLLVDKTEHLQGTAFAFRREARRLKTKMWWKNVKMWAIFALVAALLVYFLVALGCGFTLQNC